MCHENRPANCRANAGPSPGNRVPHSVLQDNRELEVLALQVLGIFNVIRIRKLIGTHLLHQILNPDLPAVPGSPLLRSLAAGMLLIGTSDTKLRVHIDLHHLVPLPTRRLQRPPGAHASIFHHNRVLPGPAKANVAKGARLGAQSPQVTPLSLASVPVRLLGERFGHHPPLNRCLRCADIECNMAVALQRWEDVAG
ncbi:hypothetical protein QC763_0018110 [Podospora pseudopauciseta]|uniref:Uncharacterized protein n=1 Tax=Podospora pseudopauciseta TaxID=2093780 RepID=A0ABR0I1I1_9PEZI|nr:hypothetical protein QC763_0018110 [Podospora pseudopauciseta]